MIVHPETYADKGCWISEDRVYAFVSSAVHGITEVGYHGAQPASRNARVFVHPAGVLRFAVSSAAGVRHEIMFNEFDWQPDSVTMYGTTPIGKAQVEVSASGRDIRVVVSNPGDAITSFVAQLDKASLFTDVHGRRIWKMLSGEDGWVEFGLHDEIILSEWMKRDGPYGSDFLIPEPLRRKIYQRQIRSGLATPKDLLPEYQDSPLQIYSAHVQIKVGGEGYCMADEGAVLLFTVPVVDRYGDIPPFMIRFDTGPSNQINTPPAAEVTQPVRPMPRKAFETAPSLALPGFPHIEQFFSTIPGLVDSCTIRDIGVPRATPGGYYWVWAWDALVTALTALRWGGIEVAEGTAAFVEGHRDEGRIPMRWTHGLEALDTQPPGALEALLASLVYAAMRERQGRTLSGERYALLREHWKNLSERCDRRGLSSGIGFYPDLPLRFGRTEESTVAMEAAAFYAFCRVSENCALHSADLETAHAAHSLASALEHSFCDVFWDKRRKFFIDSVDRKSGLRNTSYPLFSLLFLHYSPAVQLIRGHMKQSADFIARHLLAPVGMRLLPTWDKNAGSETVTGSWYPHWDAYALKLLRKEGHSTAIVRWLQSVELALERLGYAPEYLVLETSLRSTPSAWHRHGAASNLNCATGWYQALLEGVMGLEFDPGGLTIMPLALPLGQRTLRGVAHLGTRWDVKTTGEGEQLEELRVDGQVQHGCLKVPIRQHDGGHHEIDLLYGEKKPGPHFVEVANAEVLEASSSSRGVEVGLNALGQLDLVFSAPDDWLFFLDGKHVQATKLEYGGPRVISISLFGKHTVLLSRRS